MEYVSKVLISNDFVYRSVPNWGIRYFEAFGVNMQHSHKYDANHVEVLFYDNNIDKPLSHEIPNVEDDKSKIEAKDGTDVILTLTGDSVKYNTMSSTNKKISYSVKLEKSPYKTSVIADSSYTGISTIMSVKQDANGAITISFESAGPRGTYKVETILPVRDDYHEAKDYLEAISERFNPFGYLSCFVEIENVDRGCVDLNRDLDLVASMIKDPMLEEKLKKMINNVPEMEYGYAVFQAGEQRRKRKITPRAKEHMIKIAERRKETHKKKITVGKTTVKIKVLDIFESGE